MIKKSNHKLTFCVILITSFLAILFYFQNTKTKKTDLIVTNFRDCFKVYGLTDVQNKSCVTPEGKSFPLESDIGYSNLRHGDFATTGREILDDIIINEWNEFNTFWDELFKDTSTEQRPPKPLEDVFNNKIFIATFLGARPSSGYDISQYAALEYSDHIRILVIEQKPGPDCITNSVITYPYGFLLVEDKKKPIQIFHFSREYECGNPNDI